MEIELDALKEMALSLRSTVRSSKADWGDIIGNEIRIFDEINREKREEEIPKSETIDKIEELLSRLPSSLEIESRDAFNSDEIISMIDDNFRAEIVEYGYITLEGFWDKSFQTDILELPIGSLLHISIDDVKDRVGALIAHSAGSQTVGVTVNNSDLGNYSEFVNGLQRATKKSKFVAEYTKRGVLINYPEHEDDDDHVRHYFECTIKMDRPIQVTQ